MRRTRTVKPTVAKIRPKKHGALLPLVNATRARAERILDILEKTHPEAKCALDYRNAFEAMVERRVDAVLFSEQAEHFTHRSLIVELAEASRLPTMTPIFDIAEIGGLIAYSPDRQEMRRYVASCVDKVLRGENPGDIPIHQSVSYTLAINLKTATALGLTAPQSLLATADEVIE